MSYVKTSVNLERDQVDFLKSNGYSLSKIVRIQVRKLMESKNGN